MQYSLFILLNLSLISLFICSFVCSSFHIVHSVYFWRYSFITEHFNCVTSIPNLIY
uniref:F-box protein n=1 Tax=Riemerella anatipestifer TaxID=34085 RepID=UPI00374E01D6